VALVPVRRNAMARLPLHVARFPTGRAAIARATGILLLAGAPLPLGGQDASSRLPHYALDLRVHPAEHTIDASVTISLEGAAVRQFLLGPTYTIREIVVTGGTVDTTTSTTPIPNLRLITLRPNGAGTATLTMRYDGALFELQRPSINVVGPDLVELSVDSFWLPYQAELGAPFSVEGSVHGLAPTAVTVANVSSRFSDGVLRLSSGAAGTADLALIASPELKETNAGRVRMLAVDTSSTLATYYRRHGVAAIGFLEGVLGAMPGETATITVARRASGRGYARPGYVVVTDVPGTQPGPGHAKFVAHEFAHLWFSRASLTSEDYWLVEGPAEYLGLRYVRDSLDAAALEPLLVPIRASAAKAPSVLGHGRANDAALYAKVPMLLFELESRIGRAKMDMLLRRLAAEPRHTTGVFLQLLGDTAGSEAARDFEERLRQ